jgi:hypothetical protein
MLVWAVFSNGSQPYNILAEHVPPSGDLTQGVGDGISRNTTGSLEDFDQGEVATPPADAWDGSPSVDTIGEHLKSQDCFVQLACESLDKFNLSPEELTQVKGVLCKTLCKIPHERDLGDALLSLMPQFDAKRYVLRSAMS